MAISINPLTHVILVPRADLDLVQSMPEVRTLDLDAFRLWLRDWEDDEQGIPQLKTHDHNTEVTLSGLVYARIVEVLAPYTVEFEDGQYTINCTKANHNLADRRVPNQVSLIVNNAAGLISNAAIEHASFNGVITVDVVNGVAGTLYPTGTQVQPVNNIPDALLIAQVRGFDTLVIQGNITLDTGDDVRGLRLHGETLHKSVIVVNPDAQADGVELAHVTISGTIGGEADLIDCMVGNLSDIYGHFHECMLGGTIVLNGSEPSQFIKCVDALPGLGVPIIDLGGSGRDLGVWGYHGGLKLINKTGTDKVSVNLDSGRLILDSTITNGQILVKGVGLLLDGSTGSAAVDSDGLMSKETITKITWNTVWLDVDAGSAGTAFPLGTSGFPVNNMADAQAIAARESVREIHAHGNLTLQAALGDMTILSHAPEKAVITLNNQDVDESVFRHVTLAGAMNGRVCAYDCILSAITNLEGDFNDSFWNGNISIKSGGRARCYNTVSMAGIPLTVDLNGDGYFTDSHGTSWWVITNMTDPAAFVAIIGNSGVTVDNTNTAGNIYISGDATLDANLGAGVTVNTDYRIAAQVWNEALGGHTTGGTYGAEVAIKADIAAAAATSFTPATSGSVIYGSEDAGTYASAVVRDNAYWQVGETGPGGDGLAVEMVFNLPCADCRPGAIEMFGRYEGLPANTHFMVAWAYNYEASAWEILEEPCMPGGHTTDATYTHPYYERHIDRANNDEVKIRFIHNVTSYNASHTMYLDYVAVSSINVVTAADVAGAVWDAEALAHTLEGSMGKFMQEILGLSGQRNFRLFDMEWSAAKKMLSGTARAYPTPEDVDADTNHIVELSVTATYDGQNRMVETKSKVV